MWEYYIEEFEFNHKGELIDCLNKRGENNWEIIEFSFIKSDIFPEPNKATVLFKRKKLLT